MIEQEWDTPDEMRRDHLDARREAMKGRHPALQQILRWFDYGHLSEGKARTVSAHMAGVAMEMAETLKDGPELTSGLRKLLEAKDCLVRQAILDEEGS
jgi:hypothetical protein